MLKMKVMMTQTLTHALFPVLYIDPGTGSMLFTVLLGVLGTAGYLLRDVWVKLRFFATGGKKEKQCGENRLPFVIFSDHKRYWNVFKPICDEFERREQPLTYMTASPDDPALQRTYRHVHCEFIGEGNRAFSHLNFLKADLVLSTTPGLDVYQWKRSKDVKCYVHIPHAASDLSLYRMFGLDFYDTVLLSGAYQIRQVRELERRRKLPEKDLCLVGVPYLDTLQARLSEAGERASDDVTILLAPSWGSNSILNRFGETMLDALVSTGYSIIVRPHPQSFLSEKEMIERLMARYPQTERFEWNRDNDNFEVLRRSSMMISDFSGVIFDYALVFQKPVLYAETDFDAAPYDACWLDETPWTFDVLPRIGRKLQPEHLDRLKDTIQELLHNNEYEQGLKAAREETWVNRGEGAVRTVDYLLHKRQALLSPDEAQNEQ